MIVQGTEEWFAARRGKVTASRIADLMAKTKSGPGASRGNYMAELLVERLSGTTPESFSNAAMRWGTETEPHARAAYEFLSGSAVEEVGFIDHPRIRMSGASPDGLVGADGLTEIKCPNTKTHIETLLARTIPLKYRLQMQWQMACANRMWCDYISFDPRLPAGTDYWCHRVGRNDELIIQIEESVESFLADLARQETTLRARIAA